MNKQEQLWSGSFGDEYHIRQGLMAPRNDLWKRILDCRERCGIDDILEFGCGSRENLEAIGDIGVGLHWVGVDVNPNVGADIIGSILDCSVAPESDLVITCGLLIHIHPKNLDRAYQQLFDTSKKYICVMEFYNPTPVEIKYHGAKDRLWKRDFAGEMLDAYPLRLIDYGFEYHKDGVLDDVTWFLLEKTDEE